jgi:hypothetical protein
MATAQSTNALSVTLSTPRPAYPMVESMAYAPAGTLKNAANWVSASWVEKFYDWHESQWADRLPDWDTDGYLQLVPASNNNQGQFERSFDLGSDFLVSFDYWISSGVGDGGLFFYWGYSSTPTTEEDTNGGQAVFFSDYLDIGTLFVGDTLQGSYDVGTDVSAPTGVWKTLTIRIKNGRLTLNGTDVSDSFTFTESNAGTLFGFAAYNGTVPNEYRIRNVSLMVSGNTTTALTTTLEANIRATTGILTTLEKQQVKSTTAVLTTLEKPTRGTTALLTTLEKQQAKSTVGISTQLENTILYSTSALLTTLERQQIKSTVGVSTTLEKSPTSTISLLATLEAKGSSRVALYTELEKVFFSSNTALTTTLETYTPRLATNYRAIDLGTLSLANHTLTQQQIDDAIDALAVSIPTATHVVVRTYLDYASQIALWAQSIHRIGKKFVLRSAGFNDWRGTNGATQYTASDFADHATSQYVAFVDANYTIFQSGDIFEPVPDQSEDNSRWVAQYTTIGSGTGKTAFNTFITDSISQVNTALTNHSVTGVITNVLYVSPSVARDVVTSGTASLLRGLGTNDYPESGITTVTGQATALRNEITIWINPAQSAGTPWHITFGPNAYDELDAQTQSDTLDAELRTILTTLSHLLDGITISLFGDYTTSPTNQLYDWAEAPWTDIFFDEGGVSEWVEDLLGWSDAQWTARTSVATIQNLFTALTPSTLALITTLEKPGVKSTAAVLTTLELPGVKSTVALLATLSHPAGSTAALSTTLEAVPTSRAAILTTLEVPVTRATAAVTTFLEATRLSTAALYTDLESDFVRSTTAMLTTLEAPRQTTIGVLTTLETATFKSTFGILTTLQTAGRNTVSILSTLEFGTHTTIPLLTTLETASLRTTVGVLSILEQAVPSCVAMRTTLERATQETVPILTTLEIATQTTVPVLTTLEEPTTSTVAIGVVLEAIQQVTIALATELERVGSEAIALTTLLESPASSTTAVVTILESSISLSTTAVTTELEGNVYSNIAIFVILEAHPTNSATAVFTDLNIAITAHYTNMRRKKSATIMRFRK